MGRLISTEELLYAVLLDGREVFGRNAFPFRKSMERGVVYSVGTGRAVVKQSECTVLRVLRPDEISTLPSGDLWETANHDPSIRQAIKERCGL